MTSVLSLSLEALARYLAEYFIARRYRSRRSRRRHRFSPVPIHLVHRADAARIPPSSARRIYTPPAARHTTFIPVSFSPLPLPPLHSYPFSLVSFVRRLLFAACAFRGGGRSPRGAGCLRLVRRSARSVRRGGGRREEYRCRCMHIDGGNDDVRAAST